MITFVSRTKKISIFALIVLCGLSFQPNQVWAAECQSVQIKNIGIQGGQKITQSTTKFTKWAVTFTGKMVLLNEQVAAALNSVGKNVTDGAGMVMKGVAKGLDTKHKLEIDRMKQKQAVDDARHGQVDEATCRKATGDAHAAAGELVAKAMGQNLSKGIANEIAGKSEQRWLSDKDNAIATRADYFAFYMKYFCNPQGNGGLMPTEQDPIITNDGPLWCGMARGPNDNHLIDLPLHMPEILFDPTRKLKDDPIVRAGMIMTIMMMLDLPLPRKTNLATLANVGGPEAFLSKMKNHTQTMFAASYISDLWATKLGNHSPQASDWVRAVMIPDNMPTEVREVYEDKYEGLVSQSQFFDAQVAQFTGYQYSFDKAGLSSGQYDRQGLSIDSLLLKIEYEKNRELKIANMLNAAMARKKSRSGPGMASLAYNE